MGGAELSCQAHGYVLGHGVQLCTQVAIESTADHEQTRVKDPRDRGRQVWLLRPTGR